MVILLCIAFQTLFQQIAAKLMCISMDYVFNQPKISHKLMHKILNSLPLPSAHLKSALDKPANKSVLGESQTI